MTVKYEDLLSLAPKVATVAELREHPELGETADVNGELYMRVTGMYRWTHITAENFDLVHKTLDVVKTMVDNFKGRVQDQVRNSPIYATVEDIHAAVPQEGNPFARLEHEGGDIYMFANDKWSIVVKGKALAEIAELDTAEADIRLRARDLFTNEGMAMAPAPHEWHLAIEPVGDTTYPDMHDGEGKRLPSPECVARHLEYLDLQTRLMLTKSTMQAYGANAAPGMQFTESFLEEAMRKGGLHVFQKKAVGKGDKRKSGMYYCRISHLPGMNVTLEDSERRTLMVRVVHFVATRHDPDTAVYINARLHEFANRSDWRNPKGSASAAAAVSDAPTTVQ